NTSLDPNNVAVAKRKLDDPRVKASPSIFARRRVQGGESRHAEIVIVQQRSAVLVHGREAVKVERVGPKGAARLVGSRRTLANGQGRARAVADVRDPFTPTTIPVVDAVQKTSRRRILGEVDGHLAGIAAPLVELVGIDAADAAVGTRHVLGR